MDADNKVHPLLQAYADKAVELYKAKLMYVLLSEEKDVMNNLSYEFQDDFPGGAEYIFSRLKSFINTGHLDPRDWPSIDERYYNKDECNGR